MSAGADTEAAIAHIAAQISEIESRRVDPSSVRWIKRPDEAHAVADAPYVFSLDGEGGSCDWVVSLSNAAFPDAVAEGRARAEQARGALSEPLAKKILSTVSTGRFETCSFAVYPRLFPFSSNRILCKAQKAVTAPAIIQWLSNVAAETAGPVTSDTELQDVFQAPLSYAATETRFSEALRSASSDALKAVESGRTLPKAVLEHGDFWLGNILLETPQPWFRMRENFAVIDWGASRQRGYPFIDLLRFVQSAYGDNSRLKKIALVYADAIGVSARDIELYACASIGRLGLERNEFPMDRFIALAESVFVTAQRIR